MRKSICSSACFMNLFFDGSDTEQWPRYRSFGEFNFGSIPFIITPLFMKLQHNSIDLFLHFIHIYCIYILTYGAEPFLRSFQLCSHSGTSQHFKEPEGSSPCSQDPSIGPYPEPDRSNPYHIILPYGGGLEYLHRSPESHRR
jgi:hypothetical protein